MSFKQDYNIKYEIAFCDTGFKSDQEVVTYFITLVALWQQKEQLAWKGHLSNIGSFFWQKAESYFQASVNI